ncbi:hypothetical protein [Actinomadura sp. DC4]|uniref:alpha/beta fold hydrolase n=1 Tax=Actinomadura sp. DC4 TaxID=3055069 RepID=UPI0025B05575|nr:hypothetical protein [Actinomadura sp. DC4]MDN3354473.1 hypothetical protein [Actinomadura sp. DC4]
MRRLPSLAAALIAATIAAAPAQARTPAHCSTHVLHVRLADGGPAAYRMWGELCYQGRITPKTVQSLIPGGTYNHTYGDFPYRGGVYSYVRAATSAGYATFDVDRIGSGHSTHPPYTDLTLAGEATSTHDVVTALRSGAVDGHAFRHVITAGHSFGSAVGVVEAVHYRDVDGVISIGGGHAMFRRGGSHPRRGPGGEPRSEVRRARLRRISDHRPGRARPPLPRLPHLDSRG